MKFFFKLLFTWVLNLILGSFVIVFLLNGEPIKAGNFSRSLNDVLGYLLYAGAFSSILFLLLYLVYVISDWRRSSYKKPMVIIYWLGTICYTFILCSSNIDAIMIIISYLLFGPPLFYWIMNIRLWSFRKRQL